MLKLTNGASEYEANKTSASNTTDNTQNTNNNSNNTTGNETTQENKEATPAPVQTPAPAPQTKEEQIATFSTKIYSNDSARQNNISITCKTLNDTIVKNGETFSFCGTVGQASTSKGYQKADIFDKNGNKKKGLGGRKLSN